MSCAFIFVAGLVIGGIVGVVVICALVVGRGNAC